MRGIRRVAERLRDIGAWRGPAIACVVVLAGCGAGGSSPSASGSKDTKGPQSTATTLPKDTRTVQPLVPSDGRAGDNFGGALWYNTFEHPIKPVYFATPQEAAMSTDGTVAVVGSPGATIDGKHGAGAVYVFAATNGRWSQVAKLAASDAGRYDGLGWSVAVSGDGQEVLAGAPYADDGAAADIGAAYFFRQTNGTWAQVAKVRAANSVAYDGFGWSVGLSRDGSRAIVGSTGHDLGFLRDAGAAYVFRGNAAAALWTQAATLTPQAPSASGELGGAVALSADGSTAAVTELTHFDSDHKLHTGATLIFTSRDGWTTSRQVTTFDDPNHNSNGDTDAYGVNVVLSDDGKVAAVAAPDVNVGSAGGAGATYVYSATGDWRPTHHATLRLLPSDPKPYLYYGSSVALSADVSQLFIGVDGAGFDDQGAAELLRMERTADGRGLRVTARIPIGAPNRTKGRFGTAVAISADGSTGVATSPWLTVAGAKNQGSAYAVPFPKQ